MRTKEIKGITIISLVVTIVVLLILAGVSASIIIGNNSLFDRAKSTQKVQTIAGIKEALELEKADIQVESKTVNLENYLEQISTGKKNYDLSSTEKIDNKNAYIIINDQYKFLLKDKGNGDVEIIYEGVAVSGDLTLSSYDGTDTYPNSGTFTVTNNTSGGMLSVESDAPNIVTASIEENTITVVPGTTAGKANIIVKSAANGDYAENKNIHIATVENGTISLSVTPYEGTYDGQAHNAITQVDVNPSDAKLEYSLDGNTYSGTMPTITNTSSFTVTVKASKAGYKTQTTTETVKVNKANGSLTLSSYSGTITCPNSTSFTASGTGSISAWSSNTGVATVTVSGNTIIVKSVGAGSATITVKSAASTNYNEKTATYTVTVKNPTFTEGSGVGYYADTDGDGTPDGIIFADFKNGGSGSWGGYSYTISTVTGLKEYYVSKTNYNGPFGTKNVLSARGSGNARFNVMALSDYNNSATYTFTNAKSITSGDWRTPTKEDLTMFAGQLVVKPSNYSGYGLKATYWSSTVYNGSSGYYVTFNNDFDIFISFNGKYPVRLARTF